MKSVYKIGLALLLFAGIANAVRAGDDVRREFTKTIKKEFDISANGTTAIYNKYGKVDVKTWDRNRVKVDVTIIVNASSESNAQKVFDRINVNFYNKSDYVKAETQIEPYKKEWWDWSTNNKSDYSINYEVFLPATNNLELANKYGDTYIASLSGRVNVDIKYGNIKLQGVNNNAKVVLAYGNGSVGSAQNISGDIAYAKLDCGDVKDVEFVSKYSRVTLDKAENILANTKYDTYEIAQAKEFRNEGKYDNIRLGTIQDVIVNSKYTNVSIEKLGNLLDLNLGYGGASVGVIGKNFTSVNLVGSYTDFKLGLESGANFKLDAAANYAGINYPPALSVSYEKEKGSSHEVQGHLGSQTARGTITARLNHGGLKVKQE